MYDMPFLPDSATDPSSVLKRINELSQAVMDLEERVADLEMNVIYLDCAVHNIDQDRRDPLGDCTDIPDGRIPC